MGRSLLISCATVAFALATSGVVPADGSERAVEELLAAVELSPLWKGVTESGRFDEKSASGGAEETAAKGVNTQPRRLSGQPAVSQCEPGAPEGQTVALDPYSLEAKFGCGAVQEPPNKVSPDCNTVTDKCCDAQGADCSTPTILKAVGVNGSATVDENTNLITVKLEKTPTESGGKLYFKCTDNAEAKSCMVTVKMPAAFEATQCNFDRNVQLPTIDNANTAATFHCGGPVETPAPGESRVFKGEDCAGPESKLSELVPGAKLIGDQKGAFTLTVAALPSETQNLCFKCVYPDPRPKKEKTNPTATCKVTVAVKGSGAHPSKTTTASTTASPGKETGITWFAVLALALVSTADMR